MPKKVSEEQGGLEEIEPLSDADFQKWCKRRFAEMRRWKKKKSKIHMLYGGDAANTGELCYGDVLCEELVHEAIEEVWDGNRNITIKLPIEVVRDIQTWTLEGYYKPVRILFGRRVKYEFRGSNIIGKVIIKKLSHFKTSVGLKFVVTEVACHKSICYIFTTVD